MTVGRVSWGKRLKSGWSESQETSGNLLKNFPHINNHQRLTPPEKLLKSSTSFYETCEAFSCSGPLRAFLRHLVGLVICRGVSLAQLAKLCDLPNLLLQPLIYNILQPIMFSSCLVYKKYQKGLYKYILVSKVPMLSDRLLTILF